MAEQATKKLMLLFSVGEDLYACDAEPIIEIVPFVKLKHIPHAPKSFSGLLNFGGLPIPVVDFCELIAGRPVKHSLYTRIILFGNPDATDSQLITLGLVAEKVTETTNLALSDFKESGIHVKNLNFLGGVLSTQNETVQLVHVDKLFEVMKGISVYSEV